MHRVFTALVAIAMVATLAGVAQAQASGACAWQADPAPWFPPGQENVDDSGGLVYQGYTPLGEGPISYRVEEWNIIVHPGYMYGSAHAWDDITEVLATGKALIDKSAARDAFYNVCKTSECEGWIHRITSTSNVTFNTDVDTDDPAYARAAGVTSVRGTLTGLNVKAKAGCECGCDEPDEPTVVHLSWQESGLNVAVDIPLAWGSNHKTDAASGADNVPDKNVLDEEYILHHELRIRAMADGYVFNWTGNATAHLDQHYVYIRTQCRCIKCGGALDDTQIVNGP